MAYMFTTLIFARARPCASPKPGVLLGIALVCTPPLPHQVSASFEVALFFLLEMAVVAAGAVGPCISAVSGGSREKCCVVIQRAWSNSERV